MTAVLTYFYWFFIFSLFIQQARANELKNVLNTYTESCPDQPLPKGLIYHAALVGDLGLVQQLIARGINISEPNSKGVTPITMAVDNNHPDIVKELLAHGADPDSTDGEFPLIISAIIDGHFEIFKLLVDAGANTQHKILGQSLFYVACTKRNSQIVELFVNMGVNLNEIVSIDDGHHTALVAMLHNTHFTYFEKKKLLQLFIEHKVDLNQKTLGTTCFGYMLHANKIKEAMLLIQHGADINAEIQTQLTPLAYVVSKNNIGLASLLITFFADTRKDHQLLLNYAFKNDNPQMVTLLAETLKMTSKDLQNFQKNYPKTFAAYEQLQEAHYQPGGRLQL